MGFFDIFGQKHSPNAQVLTSARIETPMQVAPVSDIAPIHAEELPPMPLPPLEEAPPADISISEPLLPPRIPQFTAPSLVTMPSEQPTQVHLSTSSLFISSSDYRAILGRMNLMRTKIADMEHYLSRLNAIKNDKDHHIERWCSSLEDIEKKLGYADQIIAKADG